MKHTRLRLQQLQLRENQLFLILAIVVGVLAGLSAVLFSLAIDLTSRGLFGLAPSRLRLFAIPPIVSLLTGLLLLKVFRGVRGSGVPQTKAAYHLSNGFIPGLVPLGKFITGVLCIGSGHSMGREGPSVQIGAGIASVIGRWVGLPPARARDLIPIGAAGALSAAFNTPVAAVLFSLEEIIGDMNATLLGSTVVASVAAVVVERSLLGNEPLFHVPAYHLVHPAELAAYAVLGIVGGFVSLLFAKSLLAARTLFRRLPAATTAIQPAMGGLAMGALLLVSPAIMGVGYEYVDQALNGGLLARTMVMFCALKLVATVVSYASGNAGGIFAPSLYIGAMAGGAIGMMVHRVAPFPTADPGAYALVGMGTLFAGIIRAPMTSVFMIFEITQDYQILVPLMVANLLSFAISKRYQPTPLYHALLFQDGVHLPAADTPAVLESRTAADLMDRNFPTLPEDTAIARALKVTDTAAVVLGDHRHGVHVVRRERLAEAVADGHGDDPVSSLAHPLGTHVHPDHSFDEVLARLPEADGLLPVVSRTDTACVEGMITLKSIKAASGSRT